MIPEECNKHICSNDDKDLINNIIGTNSNSIGFIGGSVKKTSERPLNAIGLGQATWPLLHRMSLKYPLKPTDEQKTEISKLITSFSWLYPCIICATDFRKEIEKSPPRLENREELSLWLCEQHNLVNKKLMKPEFKCDYNILMRMYGK